MTLTKLAVCVVLIGCGGLLSAQLDTASLIGVVSDASGAVVAGAKVEVRNMDTGITTQLTTSLTALPVTKIRRSAAA